MPDETIQSAHVDDASIVIYKGRFRSNSLSLYGLFLIVFNPYHEVETHNAVVSTFSSLYDYEPHTGWERYEEMILDMKWKGTYNNSMTTSLMDQLGKIATDDHLRKQFADYLSDYRYDAIDSSVFDMVNRVVHDKNLIVESGIQELGLTEYQETKDKRYKSSGSATKSGPALEDGAVILSVEPILAPVKGKPIFELKVGDRIMTKITPNSDRANYFIDLLNLRIENHVKPVPAEVIDIKAESRNDPIEILTKIGPGIYGKCVEDEKQVKLRLYDPAIDGPLAKQGAAGKAAAKKSAPEKKDAGGISTTTYVIIGLFVLILVIFIMLIMISF